MFMWGLSLMVIGALSFVLPMMGRQFILVTALGLTGAGSAVVGIGLFVVGFLLFNSGRNQMARDSESLAVLKRPDVSNSTTDALRIYKDAPAPTEVDTRVISEKAFAHAEAGDADAQLLIGMSYLSGVHGLPQDPKQAAEYFLKSAAQGQGLASFMLAGMYSDGVAFPVDYAKARMWAVNAKDLGAENADEMIESIDVKRRAKI